MSTPTIPIYVAGASAEVERAERWRDALLATGRFTLTHDWMAQVRAAREEGHATDRTLAEGDRVHHARADWGAVLTAHVVWLLLPEKPSTGCWVELGMALEHQRHEFPSKLIVMSGANSKACLFTALVPTHVGTDVDAFDWIMTHMKIGHWTEPLLRFQGVPRSELEGRIETLVEHIRKE
jgi:hypothetical protein